LSLLLMSRWVGGEGWTALGHSGAKVEVAEKSVEKKKKERELLVGKEKLGEADFWPT